MDAFSESSRRAALRIREIVRGNGDASTFAFEKGLLLRGLRAVPAVMVGSEIAVHILEYHTRNAAVCSYNRIVRFDRKVVEDDMVIGLSCYMGETPVAERIAVGNGFLPHELANYRLRLPRTGDLGQVIRMVQDGVDAAGVPAHAHAVQPFV
jgi:hypothetical protein